MTLMESLIECENALGWIPKGKDNLARIKTRATMHHIITQALTRQGRSVEDFALALAYCRRKRLPVTSPLQLLPLIAEARTLAPAINRPHALDVRTQMARDWESNRADDETPYWLGRLVRSIGPARADTLDEWAQAGRGT